MLIRYPNGVEVSGEVLDIQPPERIIFTYGYANNPTFGPGSSRVTIELESIQEGTRLVLRHAFAEAADRDHHVQGWRYQLSVFANVVSDVAQAGAQQAIDRWFEAWADPNPASREATLEAIASPAVRFRDRLSRVEGLADLLPHVSAAQQFMPGFRMERTGDVRHCQGTVLASWVAKGPDGQPRAAGTNVFLLGADGLIDQVTGLWS